MLQHKRADKKPRIPDHLTWDLWIRACRNKRGRQGHKVHLSIPIGACVCARMCARVCVPDHVHTCLPDLSGEWVQARKQVPIVQLGVMRAVMRVWVSWAAHYKCQASREPMSISKDGATDSSDLLPHREQQRRWSESWASWTQSGWQMRRYSSS